MCRSKMATRASDPSRSPKSNPKHAVKRSSSLPTEENSTVSPSPRTPHSRFSNPSHSSGGGYTSSSYRLDTSVATASFSGAAASLSSLRDSLPQSARIYDFAAIRAATNNFLRQRHSTSSSSSQSWRCVLSGMDVIVFQRKLRTPTTDNDMRRKLSVISKSHFTSIVKLLGVSISGEFIYLVYEYVQGSDLGSCLRNKMNPDFTVLSTWNSRMQIATDVAHGLDYIHDTAGLSIDMVHKHVKSSGIIVTEPSFNARICHFGAAELSGENASSSGLVDGVRGYMSPELKATGIPTQKSDVYAFGVVILELMTGKEPMRYRLDPSSGNHRFISVIDTAREAVEGSEVRLRTWVDRRLKDSFPVEVAEKLARVALQCVEEDPDKRPDMKWVAGKISKLYLGSKIWSNKFQTPTEISVSLAPR